MARKLTSRVKWFVAAISVPVLCLFEYGLCRYNERQLEQSNAVIWPTVQPLPASQFFDEVASAGHVTVDMTTYQRKPVFEMKRLGADDMSASSPFTCPIPDGEPLFIRTAVGGYDKRYSRVLYINSAGPWDEFLGPLGATRDPSRIRFWYSFAKWHELGHAFQATQTGGPADPLFQICDGPRPVAAGLLNRESGADIFALAGLLRERKTGPAVAWPKGMDEESALENLIQERKREPGTDHRTDSILACVHLPDLEGTDSIDSAALQELKAARERLRNHDPSCRTVSGRTASS